jgi:hypothetical protein
MTTKGGGGSDRPARLTARRLSGYWREHIADTALRRDGVIDTRADVYAAAERRPLAEHLDDWANAQRRQGRNHKANHAES